MAVNITIPSPGESITEVEIAAWFVKDGDFVEKDQEIAELESEKATLNLIAEESGKIKIMVEAGETVEVNQTVAEIDTEAKGAPKKKSAEKPGEKAKQESKKEETKEPVPEKKPKPQAQKEEPAAEYSKVKITPLARKKMEEKKLSVKDIMNGIQRITSDDVDYIAEQAEPSKSSKPAAFSRNTEQKKISQLRKKLSKRLVSVKNETAMLTTFNEVDMSRVIAMRKAFQKEFMDKHGIKLGFMSFFTKAAAVALKFYPNVNSMIDGEQMVQHHYADIGIAVQAKKGLMVPVIRNAESKNLVQLEKDIYEMAQKARNNKLSIDEMTGGTFTITNGGVFGSLLSTPIINPPQAGILGMHNIQERPVAENGKVVVRPVMYLALSYDHRVIDGKDSVGFLVKIKELIEDPFKMLFDEEPERKLLDL